MSDTSSDAFVPLQPRNCGAARLRSPAGGWAQLHTPPLPPKGAAKASPALSAATAATGIKRKATRTNSTAAVSLKQLLLLSREELEAILEAGKSRKGADTSCCSEPHQPAADQTTLALISHQNLFRNTFQPLISGFHPFRTLLAPPGSDGLLVRTAGGCDITIHKASSKPGAAGSHKQGDPNPYPQFNSSVLSYGGSNKFKLYQVAAALAVKKAYPSVAPDQLISWSDTVGAEASHVCRTLVTVRSTCPDGSKVEATIVEENKACFNPDHLWLEAGVINRSRIKCQGDQACTHSPKCLLVVI